MSRTIGVLLGVAFVTGAAAAPAQQRPPAPHYRAITHIKIGGDGFWDYLTADPAHHRLFVSHSTLVEVVDLTTGKVVAQISPTPGVHGIALAPDLNRGFVSDGRDSTVTIFDLTTLKVIGTLKVTGRNPDAITYDPVSHRVFTFNGGSDNSTAIDGATGTVVGTVALPGRPEEGTPDGQGHIYANIEDKSEIAAIDTKELTVTGQWSLAPCDGPSGLAMDTAHRRLFSGCGNQVMAVSDPDAGKVVASVTVGHGVDGTAFDSGPALVFIPNGGDGTLSVIHEDAPDHYTLVQTVTTARGARTITLDDQTHRVYVPTAQFGPPPAQPAPGQRRRPSIVPGSFEVVVVAP
jgi:DNA-binding beta-propeller fold protein YncE